jgi:hypothetical protein
MIYLIGRGNMLDFGIRFSFLWFLSQSITFYLADVEAGKIEVERFTARTFEHLTKDCVRSLLLTHRVHDLPLGRST